MPLRQAAGSGFKTLPRKLFGPFRKSETNAPNAEKRPWKNEIILAKPIGLHNPPARTGFVNLIQA
jgi:hypothetical protein